MPVAATCGVMALAWHSLSCLAYSLDFSEPAIPMEYKGVRYVLRARIKREQWSIAIYPGTEVREKNVTGTKEEAEVQAWSMIDTWLKEKLKQPR